MVVWNCMSALAVTLTLSRTVLLNAEPRPKLPLMLSFDDRELVEEAAAGVGVGVGKAGRPC
jgi:hypothetical protein